MCYVDLCKAATYVPPTDDCVLRHIAADIEDDLQEKVWDFSRNMAHDAAATASLGYTINQQALVTDYLLARLRLDPESTMKQLVPQVLDESVPIIFKIALVKSCLEIARDENRLPWNPSITSMYNFVSTPLRKLFLQAVNGELQSKDGLSQPPPPPKKVMTGPDGRVIVRASPSIAQSRVELLQNLLRLCRVDPLLALLVTIHILCRQKTKQNANSYHRATTAMQSKTMQLS